MGTNFYAVKSRPSCASPIHIGKCSAGWLFMFETHNDTWDEPPVVWNTWPQVKAWLKKYTVDSTEYAIVNEYDEVVTMDEFVDLVEAWQNDPVCRRNPDNFAHARNIDGYRFMEGEFS